MSKVWLSMAQVPRCSPWAPMARSNSLISTRRRSWWPMSNTRSILYPHPRRTLLKSPESSQRPLLPLSTPPRPNRSSVQSLSEEPSLRATKITCHPSNVSHVVRKQDLVLMHPMRWTALCLAGVACHPCPGHRLAQEPLVDSRPQPYPGV